MIGKETNDSHVLSQPEKELLERAITELFLKEREEANTPAAFSTRMMRLMESLA